MCDLLTAWTNEGSHIISINTSLVQIGLQLFKWGHFYIFSLSYNLTSDDLWPWYMTLTAWTYEGSTHIIINKLSLVPIRLQLFKWGHFHIFSLSYNLTSDDLWCWYVTFDLINKWGFPCCIYDPTLVEIHQRMWKLQPNVHLFSKQTTADNNITRQQQQQTTVDKVILRVFPAKAADTKKELEFTDLGLRARYIHRIYSMGRFNGRKLEVT